jgi:predicted transcriptional regulator YheO
MPQAPSALDAPPDLARAARHLPGVVQLEPGSEAAISACIALFYPHLEAVLHDVRADRIVRVWNSFSDRAPGHPSLLSAKLISQLTEGEVIGPYAKVETDGSSVTSVSVPFFGNALLLCFNFDRSVLDGAVQGLVGFAAAMEPQSRALFELDWRDGINELISTWCREHARPRSKLVRSDRIQLVAMIDSKGYFNTRYAATHVGNALGVSRATVYTLLKQVRQG